MWSTWPAAPWQPGSWSWHRQRLRQRRHRRALAPVRVLSGKHVDAIFTKLGLTTEDLPHRRITVVLTFLRDAGLHG